MYTLKELPVSETELDCRNLECPRPVMRVKQLLETASPAVVSVIVDNEAALENVSRFLSSRGYEVSGAPEGNLWRVSASRARPGNGEADIRSALPAKKTKAAGGEEKILVMIVSPVFGTGDDILGARLMKNFLTTLPELGNSLWRVVLLNGGVTLSAEDSPVVAELRALEAEGVEILVCGACLEHFGLKAKKAVGQTTNMLDVVTGMQLAEKIVRI
jgi:selenium metabolism protein YedF